MATNTLARRDAAHRAQQSLLDNLDPQPPVVLPPTAPTPPPAADPDAGKRSRNANYHNVIRRDLNKSQNLWMSRLVLCGPQGATLYELSLKYNTPQNNFSGRFTELVEMGRAIRTKIKRPTAHSSANVFVAAEFFPKNTPPSTPAAAARPAVPETVPSPQRSTDYMPDQSTAPSQPRDTADDLVTPGCRYELYVGRQLLAASAEVFEDDHGNLHVFKTGSTHTQRVDQLPNNTRWERVA